MIFYRTLMQKNGIICLETEWEHTVERNRRSIHTKPLLEFLEKSSGCEIIYRRVATKNELQYYLRRFNLAKYDNYSIIYLSFHEDTHSIFLEREKGDEAVLKLSDLASLSDGVFKDRFVHFNSCRTFLRFREVEHLVIEVFRFLAGEAVVFTPELTGVKDIVTQADIERELAKVPEKEKAAFLEQYAETYVQMHVDRIVEENYRRIKADIGDIFEAHGVVLAVDDAETPENGNDPDETHEAKHQFPEDGIAEEEVPETEPVLPVDEEWEE